MKKTLFLLLLSFFGLISYAGKPTIHLIGGSTCSSYTEKQRPQYGWGEMLSEALGVDVEVVNHAKPGRSSKSFISEGRWDKALGQMKKGDYLLIQFGHNDQKKKDSTRYTAPFEEYYANLCRFISESASKGVQPVLVTSVSRRRFSEDGHARRTLGRYPAAMRKVAKDTGTPLIDVEQQSFEWLEKTGDEASKPYYMVSVNGTDNTHLTKAGAALYAGFVAEGLKKLFSDFQD